MDSPDTTLDSDSILLSCLPNRVIKREQSGRFHSHTWPEGSTLLYYDRFNKPLCARCATKLYLGPDEIVHFAVYDEGPDVNCSNCGTIIKPTFDADGID